jgi:tRNA (cmo5U34)-methyltransferase
MPISLKEKSSIEEIRSRFDKDVERFSNLDTGQQATIDAPLVLDLVAQVAAAGLKSPKHLLDLGCGAGNFTLKVLERSSNLNCTLVDLSQPMLERAQERVSQKTKGLIQIHQKDMRELSFPEESFDIILAGAVLHHLRDDRDWKYFFAQLHHWLRPDGMLFVADMIWFDDPQIQQTMWDRYGKYLESLKGTEYRKTVFNYIDQEDSPRSLAYQFRLLQECGFKDFDVLHRNSVFAAYFGRK